MPWLRIEPATSRPQVDHHHHCATCLTFRRKDSIFCAYELAATLTKRLQLEAEPLKHLPLAVCDSHINQPAYAFPLSSTGRWVLNQKATEASMFMALWLITHHSRLLSTHVCHALSSSLQFTHTLLRCLQPSLPNCNMNCYYPCSGRLDITLVTHTSV
jgi:hypothetical protein